MSLAPVLLAMMLSSAAADAAPAATDADDLRPLDPVSLWLGGLQARSSTTLSARVAAQGASAAGRVNLEDDLGLDDHRPVTHARLDFMLGHSQGLSLEYFGYRRSNSMRLARTLEFDGQVYQADARLRAELDYDFSSVSHRSWFGQGPTVWGIGLGAAHYRVRTRFDASLQVDGEQVATRSTSSEAAAAPLLALGWRHGFSDRLRAYADLSAVAKGGRLSGRIVDAAVGLEWFPFERVGLAAEYGQTRIVIERDRGDVGARLDLRLQGPSLFLRLR